MTRSSRLQDRMFIRPSGTPRSRSVRIVAQGTPGRLLKKHFGDVILQFPVEDVGDKLDGLGLCTSRQRDWCEIQTHDVDATIRTLMERGVSLNRMNMRSWSLEDLFIALTGKDLRG